MRVRSLTASGDWRFGKGRNDYLLNNKAIVQNIATRLKSFLGDCFFAVQDGIDWFNLLGSKDQLALELAVRNTILNTAEVTGLVDASVVLNHTTRRITMRYTVNTVYTDLNITPPITAQSGFLLTQDGDILTTEDGSGLIAG